MVTSGLSQTIYPKKILIGSDTVVAFTKPQLITINRSLNDYIHLEKLYRNLQMELSVSDSLCNLWRLTSTSQESIIKLEQSKVATVQKYNEQLQLSLKNEKKKSRKAKIGVGIGSIIVGIIVGVCCK